MKKFQELVDSLNQMELKELRQLRNRVNNRITSFKNELSFGKKLPHLSPSHQLSSLNFKDCSELKVSILKELKNRA